MFKRKRSPSRASSRFLTKRQANRTFKHAVRQKVININVKCQKLCVDPGISCPNGGKFDLVSNLKLQGNFGGPPHGYNDALRITRLEGTLWFKPDYRFIAANTGSCIEAQVALSVDTIFRMGLVKSQVQQALGGLPIAINPLGDGVDSFHLADATDARYLKTWNHLFQVTAEQSCGFNTQSVLSSCAPGYIVPPIIAGESIGYIVPPDNCCVPCEGQVAGTFDSTAIHFPGWKGFSMSYRRPIVMKENDDLNLWFGWEAMRDCDPDSVRPVQPPMQMLGHVFMTVEA